jgi:hypothetical protein
MNSIIFSEQIDAFSTYADSNPIEVFHLDGDTYGIYETGEIKNINGGYNVGDNIQFVSFSVNTNPSETKAFDNVELHFTNNNSNPPSYAWFTNTKQSSLQSTSSDFDNREGTHKLSIPRASSDLFADRMRDKFIICNYEFIRTTHDSKYFSLPYIKTKFRYSSI